MNRKRPDAVRNANKYFVIEGAVAIAVSWVISSVVIAVFGNSMYGKTYGEAYDTCQAEGSRFGDIFKVPEEE